MLYKVTCLELCSYNIETDKKAINFFYQINVQDKKINFTEKIILPDPIPENKLFVIFKILESLHLMLGISYFKMYCPEKVVHPYELDSCQAEFWNTVYKKGLGEFFYKNNIDYRDFSNLFISNTEYIKQRSLFNRANKKKQRTLLGIGGGKDSIVAFEMLKKQKKEVTGFILANKGEDIKIKEEVLKIMNIPYLIVRREMDEKLLKQKDLPKSYNGHVPITAIYSFISLLLAVAEDFTEVIIPNGKSADSGNVEYLGEVINHQWSKSKEFEDLFQSYVKLYSTPGVEFASNLRGLTDFEIFKEFVKYPKYFSYFSSCNKNFAMFKKQKTKWCGQCAKCAYTFIMLAAYLPKLEVIKIFGKDLLADSSLIPLYKDLRGEGKMKPFDCVGTAEEVREAFKMIKEEL